MAQSKTKLNHESNIGNDNHFSMPFQRHNTNSTSQKLISNKNRFARLMQDLFVSPAPDKTGFELIAADEDITEKNYLNPKNTDEQSLLDLENCADAARKTEGSEQYEQDF